MLTKSKLLIKDLVINIVNNYALEIKYSTSKSIKN